MKMNCRVLFIGAVALFLAVGAVADGKIGGLQDSSSDRTLSWYHPAPTPNVALAGADALAKGDNTFTETQTGAFADEHTSASGSSSVAATNGKKLLSWYHPAPTPNVALAGADALAKGDNTFTETQTNAFADEHTSASGSSSVAATNGKKLLSWYHPAPTPNVALAGADALAKGDNTFTETQTNAFADEHTSASGSSSVAATNGKKLLSWYHPAPTPNVALAGADALAKGDSTFTETQTNAFADEHTSASGSSSVAATGGRKMLGDGKSFAFAGAEAVARGEYTFTNTETNAVTTPNSATATAESLAVSNNG